MLLDAFKQPTTATITNVNPRTEKHGEEDVLAVDVNLEATLPNTALTPEVLDLLYLPVDTAQGTIPGETTPRTKLRPGMASLVLPLRLQRALEGRIVAIEHGEIGEADAIEFACARVHKAALAPLEGGSMTLSFQVQQSEVDPPFVGDLCAWLRKSVRLSIATSEPAEQKRADSVPAPAPKGDVRQQQLDALGATT